MKNNLRQKQPLPASSQQNRLNKTQQPPHPKGQYLDNTYHIQKKPTMYDKPVSEKPVFPPRAGSTQKINYKVQDNMTNSKINQAKMGLQLLKKKMARNGMSRQKNERITSAEKRTQQTYNMRKVPSKQEEYNGYEKQYKNPTPTTNQRKAYDEPPKKTPSGASKTIEDSRPIRRPPPTEEYSNPNQEKPLNSNKDFMALLEREMAKESGKSQPMAQPMSQAHKQPSMMPEQTEEIQLVQCSMGCGRQFNVLTVAKHEKVCQKVFQSKRKAFNSAARRAPEVEDFKAPPSIPQREEKIKNTKQKPKEEKVPKWKLQSAAFRAGLKAGRGQQLSAEEKTVAEQASGMIQCPTCGRKFNQTAGKRHITFCESKAKQLPKMNTTKKR